MIKCLVILVVWAIVGFIAGVGSMIVAMAIRYRKGMDELEWGEIVSYIVATKPSWFNIWFLDILECIIKTIAWPVELLEIWFVIFPEGDRIYAERHEQEERL